MVSRKALFCIVVGLLSLATEIDAACKKCSTTTYAACINETYFKFCYDGVNPSNEIAVCPENQVCTNQQGVCKPRGSANTDCGICGVCTNGFSCISQTQFQYCVGTVKTGIIGKCPDGQYCSLLNMAMNRNICVKSCSDEPTCYAAEIVPTPAPIPSHTTICEGKTVWGYYDNIYDSTCQSYVYCEKADNVVHAILYNCSSGYFSESAKKCIETKPSRCP